MGLFKIFKTPNPNQYNYIPRYWDPAKEEKQARLKYLESLAKEDPDVEDVKSRMAVNFRKKGFGHSHKGLRKKAVYKSNMILISTIIILFLLAYILLYVNLPEILNYIK